MRMVRLCTGAAYKMLGSWVLLVAIICAFLGASRVYQGGGGLNTFLFLDMSVSGARQNFTAVWRCLGLQESLFVTDLEHRRVEASRIRSLVDPLLLRRHLRQPCYKGYCGPWVEDLWAALFSWRDVGEFGPFVPLFIPWLALWTRGRRQYFHFVRLVSSFLKPEFVYVTLSQNDDGVEGRDGQWLPQNLFIVSSGGKGHVPFPLFSGELRPILTSPAAVYDTVFLGHLHTHPVRDVMARQLRHLKRAFVGRSSAWRRFFCLSKTVLCPRGFGRNSFRLMEALQLGLVPIYIYDDIPWLPYYDSLRWGDFSLVVRVTGETLELRTLVLFLRQLSPDRLGEMRGKIGSLYDSHFSRAGAFRQLRRFLRFGFDESDLRCAERAFVR